MRRKFPVNKLPLAVAAAIHLSGCVGVNFSVNGPLVNEKTGLPNQKSTPDGVGRLNDDGSTTYVLHDERSWCGLTVWAVLPVPLWLPVCRHYREVTYLDGKPVRWAHQAPATYFVGCGPFVPLLWLANKSGGSGFCRADLPPPKTSPSPRVRRHHEHPDLENAVSDGFLRHATTADADAWTLAVKNKYEQQGLKPPHLPPAIENAYVVLKKFAYPAGLIGEHSAAFYVPSGIPLPSGNYGHSRIYDFNTLTLECSGGSECWDEYQKGKLGHGATLETLTIDGR